MLGIYNSSGVWEIYMKHFRLTLLAVLCAFIVCACSATPAGKDPKTSEGSAETSAETTVSSLKESPDTPEYSEMMPETTPSETEPPKPLTDEEAMTGFTNYLYFKIKNLQKILDEDKVPCTWGIASSSKNEIMIMFKSNTGALLRYHINRNSGKAYVTQYSVISNSFFRTKETVNVRSYINRKPTPTPYVIKPNKGTPAAKQAVKPKIKVSNAVSKESVISGKKHPYRIPKVTISTKNTDAANKRMKSDLSKYPLKGDGARQITYSYHVTGKLVSILVRISDDDPKTPDNFKVYNIAISSGKLVKDGTVVRLAGKTNRKFYAMVKATYKKYKGGSSVPASDAKKIRKANLKRYSYKYVEPYVGKNGHLCFVGSVKVYGGSGTANVLFDAVKKGTV